MAVTNTKLVGGTILDATSAILYTVTAGTTVLITSINLTGLEDNEVWIYLCPDGSAGTSASLIANEIPVAKGAQVLIQGAYVISVGMTIQARGLNANATTIYISGVVVS